MQRWTGSNRMIHKFGQTWRMDLKKSLLGASEAVLWIEFNTSVEHSLRKHVATQSEFSSTINSINKGAQVRPLTVNTLRKASPSGIAYALRIGFDAL